VGVVIPELNKKLTGMSFRVPTSDVSVVDLTVELNTAATIRRNLRRNESANAKARSKGVLGYTDDKVVATDFRGEPCTIGVRRRRRHCAWTAPSSRLSAGTTTSGATPTSAWKWFALFRSEDAFFSSKDLVIFTGSFFEVLHSLCNVHDTNLMVHPPQRASQIQPVPR
jgi:hypothetical protein